MISCFWKMSEPKPVRSLKLTNLVPRRSSGMWMTFSWPRSQVWHCSTKILMTGIASNIISENHNFYGCGHGWAKLFKSGFWISIPFFCLLILQKTSPWIQVLNTCIHSELFTLGGVWIQNIDHFIHKKPGRGLVIDQDWSDKNLSVRSKWPNHTFTVKAVLVWLESD